MVYFFFLKHRSELEPEPPLFSGSGSSQKGRLRLHNTGYRYSKFIYDRFWLLRTSIVDPDPVSSAVMDPTSDLIWLKKCCGSRSTHLKIDWRQNSPFRDSSDWIQFGESGSRAPLNPDSKPCFSEYWDITAVCEDGKLEINRLVLGLCFPQITGSWALILYTVRSYTYLLLM